ncbi:hypothetical protein J008_00236 [Cryptococcus neoformans]|nr:hypothetical protein C362_00230 [Cryptococcus neoformans var. grubii Bt1]OWZ81255.1 hypothetical protein C365_00225 [Cryptococcus neoformans var. grubii Bt85]OXG24692.1 hypothetical protein C366_00224 [Cryptococcus neoformans var. grubii Tu401-1]OXG36701.1 hypothetical protein C367_00231 [Cryptococcus neoformans var. grubii Ze90-1]OXH42161.1 hypothetical protein J008_00236 [Cryptococcus neoformans var. grubii]
MLKQNVRKSIYGKLSEIRTKLKEDRLRIREQLEDHFKQTLAAQKAIDEVREERFQVELERERQRAEVYEGIIKRRLALEEKREARPQGLWELEKERLGLNAGRTGSE